MKKHFISWICHGCNLPAVKNKNVSKNNKLDSEFLLYRLLGLLQPSTIKRKSMAESNDK